MSDQVTGPGGDASAYIDLLRHGLTERPDCLCGRTDVPLSPAGRAQLERTASAFGPWDRVVSSPRRRCAVFADDLATRMGLAHRVEHDLAEIDLGRWDGRAFADLARDEAEHFSAFWRDPMAHPPPDGEHLEVFARRVLSAYAGIVGDAPAGSRTLVVCHGGVIRVILAHVYGLDLGHMLRMEIDYASLSRIRMIEGHASVVCQALTPELFQDRNDDDSAATDA
ncbi:MAG: histidine phosphatase family protein [Gammaproteobacteria bacterium]